VAPEALHQRVPIALGSTQNVKSIVDNLVKA